MLKIGFHFLWSSSLGVLYRHADYAYSTNPAIKWLCLLGLSISLICFVYTYFRLYAPRALKAYATAHMLKSPEWKTSPQA